MLNDFSGELVMSVAAGVGFAVLLGVLRFFYAWPLKYLAIPLVSLVLTISFFFSQVPLLADILGLAWHCGAVTTGPITIPLVLAMGLGVGANVPGVSDGFGILALASVGPILTVLTVGLYTQRQERANSAKEHEKEVLMVVCDEAEVEDIFDAVRCHY
ncbi:MAG: hypothetical protein ACI9ON_001871 [Limisphaerales bacterium]